MLREKRDFVLLDVRENFELAAARIEGALHIPLRELPARTDDLDAGASIAVLCHHGHRSAHAVQFLQMRGFAGARNVEGGIEAYAQRIDPAVGTY